MAARVFITGSADGLGQMAARLLVGAGHEVVLHGRSPSRAREAQVGVPGAAGAVHGDLSDLDEIRSVAAQVNVLGPFDCVIHNAGIGYREASRSVTRDGLSRIFAVNSLAPYMLTALIARPRRLVYLSSGLHRQGDASLEDLQWEARRWDGLQAYADSKLHDLILALAIARRFSDVQSNALEPGWVATKMGGAGAPDSLVEGPKTQAWLAAGDDPRTRVSGRYFYHQQPRASHPAAADPQVQERLLEAFAGVSGVTLSSA